MHGCMQGAADAAQLGFSELAEQHGFLVVYPEQQTANNSARCFNWGGVYGDMTALKKGQLENQSIKEMVDKMKADHGVDPNRVYVAGFSAGGAEAVLVAATWPELFKGAASIGGIPYACPASYMEVFNCQNPGVDRTPAAWGDKVRAANSGFAGPWPRMSIWQGSADVTVGTRNRTELVEQWTNVTGANAAPATTETVAGSKHETYTGVSGVLVESWEVPGMTHGVPVKPGDGCGVAGQYAFDKGICAPAKIVDFFGLSALTPPGKDAGATSSPDAGKPSSSASSSSSSSSSSSGGAAPGDAGPAGNSASGELGSRNGSTCSAAPGGSGSLAWLGAALAAIGLVARRRSGR
jgi:poly(hydroxyalkanoate) depolymerase family esterase